MKKHPTNQSLLKTILYNGLLPMLIGLGFFQLLKRALGSINHTEGIIYWFLVVLCVLGTLILLSPSVVKWIGKEILRRFACRFLPSSRFAKPPLSYDRARRLVAEKKYDEAIGAFQDILRYYPEEKEPYNQIIWIANLTGQTHIAEIFSRKLEGRLR